MEFAFNIHATFRHVYERHDSSYEYRFIDFPVSIQPLRHAGASMLLPSSLLITPRPRKCNGFVWQVSAHSHTHRTGTALALLPG